MAKSQLEVIDDLQNNPDYIILNNLFAIPNFVGIDKNGNERNGIYTPKIFFEIVSQLTPIHLDCIGEYVTVEFSVGDFLASIAATNSNNDYNHVINSVKKMQKISIEFENEKLISGFSVITHYKYEKGDKTMTLDIRKELAQAVLTVKKSENFSFLKKYLFKLNNAQAIKFFPFFISWRNKGMIEMNLELFRKKFDCDTEGYKKFRNLKVYILDPALKEINEKTDLTISYKLLGKNLTGQRQRVTGLQFFISEKTKQKELPEAEKTFFEVAETAPQVIKPIAAEPEGEYLEEILRIFLVFEPQSTSENIKGFLSAFESPKAVVEACLYAEQEQAKGNQIKNFRGYLVSGIPKGLGAGMLEQKTKEQAQKQKIEQRKKAEAEKVIQLENLLKQANDLRIAYQKGINQVIRNTATEADKDKVADILRGQSTIYAKRTLDDFRKPMLVGIFIGKFIETYPERFETVQNTYKPPFQVIMSAVKKLDPTKCKELFY